MFLQGFSATGGRRPSGLLPSLAAAALVAGVLSGCSGGSKSTPSGAPSPAAIEREENNREVSALKGEEATEEAKQRELLAQLESKKREEAATEAAKRTIAEANAKAKRRERQAERAVKRKEKEATEKAEKQKASEKKASEKKTSTPAGKKPAAKKPKTTSKPKESIATPPTVTVPSNSN